MTSKKPAIQKVSKHGRQEKSLQTDRIRVDGYGKRPKCKVQYEDNADPMSGMVDTPVETTGTTASEKSVAQQPPRKYDPLPSLDDEPEGLRWAAKSGFHASFQTNEPQSKIGRADFRVAKQKECIAWHERNHPGGVPGCETNLANAIVAREALSDTPENHWIGDPEKPKLTIQERIKDLNEALASSEFEPERVNIKAAIDAYETGEVGYTKNYTLIWAGQVVDTAATYGAFSRDRAERLDRYAEKYGPHWLWWESPLNLHPKEQFQAKGCQIIPRIAQIGGLGHFYIHQKYQKRAGFVRRLPDTDEFTPLRPSERSAFQSDDSGRVNCGDDGPMYRLVSMLDSGASCASLYTTDLQEMGIVKKYYSAQSYASINLANGVSMKQRIFEMYVEVDGNDGTPIIDPNNPMVPNRRVVGGTYPVLEIKERIKDPYDPASYLANHRLSGLMPFLSSYVSIVPGSNIILLGENRNDIIGHYKMPPFQVWDLYASQQSFIKPDFSYIENPNLWFHHQDQPITEKDVLAPGFPPGVETTKDGQTYTVYPYPPRGQV